MTNEVILSDVTFNTLNRETKTVSARELHSRLGVETDFRHWFPRMCEYGFFAENSDFFNPVIFDQVQIEGNRQVKRQVTDYNITLDMAKEICMIQRNEDGKKFRRYFIEVEKQWSQVVKSPIERILANSTNQLDTARAITQMLEIEHQKQLSLEAQKQATIDYYEGNLKKIHKGVTSLKAERDEAIEDFKGLYNKVVSCDGWFTMAEISKQLAIKDLGPNKLFAKLREIGILMKNNEPYQNYVNNGYFKIRLVSSNGKTYHQTLVSKVGLVFIEKKVRKAGE